MNGNCYIYPLIPPDLPLEYPEANSSNSKEYTLVYDDDEFVQDFKVAIFHAIEVHRITYLETLAKKLKLMSSYVNLYCRRFKISKYFDDPDKALKSVPLTLENCPFRELIIQTIPIHKNCADIKRIHWHQ